MYINIDIENIYSYYNSFFINVLLQRECILFITYGCISLQLLMHTFFSIFLIRVNNRLPDTLLLLLVVGREMVAISTGGVGGDGCGSSSAELTSDDSSIIRNGIDSSNG